MINLDSLSTDVACGNPNCGVSYGIHDGPTFGAGLLDEHGYWEHPCHACAREHERLCPSDYPCWPFESEAA